MLKFKVLIIVVLFSFVYSSQTRAEEYASYELCLSILPGISPNILAPACKCAEGYIAKYQNSSIGSEELREKLGKCIKTSNHIRNIKMNFYVLCKKGIEDDSENYNNFCNCWVDTYAENIWTPDAEIITDFAKKRTIILNAFDICGEEYGISEDVLEKVFTK